jgi:hypothetical protein
VATPAVEEGVVTPKMPVRTPVRSTTEESVTGAGEKDTAGYWLTTSSSKRHNSKCRYYKTSKGRPCGPNDGTACKVCGG